MSFIKINTDKQTYKGVSDEDIVRKILVSPERKLQEELYERYVDRVFHKCLNIVNNKEVARDLTHDVMIKVFLKLSKYSEKSPFYGWIFAITYNHCMDHLKAKKKFKLSSFEDYKVDIPEEDSIEMEHKELKELQFEQLEHHYQHLSDQEKLILLMRYQDGMSIRQISIILKVSESAVKMRLKRSRDHLAKLIKSAGYESK